MEKNTIGIIIGSTRENRFSEYPSKWLMELGAKQNGLSFELIDLREFALPFLENATNPSHMNGVYPERVTARWSEKIQSMDGYIIVTPEYNHSYSAVLKNALDHISGEFANKPVAFVSYGSVGGARAVEQLRLVAIEHQMAPIRNAIHIMAPWFLREEDGSLTAGALDPYVSAADAMFTQLKWWTSTLKDGRLAALFAEPDASLESA